MTPRFTIALEGLRFYAPHGVYEGEALTGNEFEVDLAMEVEETGAVTQLEQTLNYVTAYELIRDIFATREALLERLCQAIAARLESECPQMAALEISIRKLTPAIPHFEGSVRVSYKKSYNPQR
ncbi:MAG: dihydroneopterin aldolase [Chitinophagaceae bacterium]|nr:MAG: dihydroneopterin aldolase [Chitinophagaceae bacterium]